MAGLTDFNDLHVVQGTDAVRAQLELVASSPAANHPVVDIPPDDFYDHYEPSRALPEDSGGFGKWNLIDLVRHVSLIYGTDTVWDAREKIQMRRSYLSHIIGRELFKEWDNHPSRRVVKGLVFEPSGIVPDNHVNLFDGFPISPGTQGARGCAKILNHIYRLCGCREDEFNFLIRWMAYPLQNPGAKMATSVIMHGAEGTGKSLIWDRVIGAIYGKYAITVGQMQIESQFTGWQSCKCFAQCEEVVARNEQAHYKGRLKHLVSGATLIINEKQLPAREENNHLNTVFLSNSDKPLSLDLGDRRYLVLKIMDVPNQAYFDELLTEIDSAVGSVGPYSPNACSCRFCCRFCCRMSDVYKIYSQKLAFSPRKSSNAFTNCWHSTSTRLAKLSCPSSLRSPIGTQHRTVLRSLKSSGSRISTLSSAKYRRSVELTSRSRTLNSLRSSHHRRYAEYRTPFGAQPNGRPVRPSCQSLKNNCVFGKSSPIKCRFSSFSGGLVCPLNPAISRDSRWP